VKSVANVLLKTNTIAMWKKWTFLLGYQASIRKVLKLEIPAWQLIVKIDNTKK